MSLKRRVMMPIIKPMQEPTLEDKIKMSTELKNEIEAYNAVYGIKNLSHFLVEAAQYVLSKDKDWLAHKKIANRPVLESTIEQ